MGINLVTTDLFADRHIGPTPNEVQDMLNAIGVDSLDTLIDQTVPPQIRKGQALNLPTAQSEFNYLNELRKKAAKNKVFRSYIGLGYYNTIVPTVIKRNIFENPGWYTQYTPYQAEISQGRLEALLNFQTMVSDLTALPIANASLLDEGTAAAEAMTMFFNQKNKRKVKSPKFFVSEQCFPQTIAILKTRAVPLGVELVFGKEQDIEFDDTFFGALVQYPAMDGHVKDMKAFVERAHDAGVLVCFAADLMSLALITPPGEFGADCAVGTTQRFGVPMGYGGPHAAYFACKEDFKRVIPGRIIGVSVDRHGKPALRMALQTREQHIRREKATSNICTAQALLAIMAGMYGAWHGPTGIRDIATRIHASAALVAQKVTEFGFVLKHDYFFDTIAIEADQSTMARVQAAAMLREINFGYYNDGFITIALDQTVQPHDLVDIIDCFATASGNDSPEIDFEDWGNKWESNLPANLARETEYLTHDIFNTIQSETEMMRYIKSLENKDLSLTSSMIPLGSCTMKLNAATQLEPVSWPEFAQLHPFAPKDQAEGYQIILSELEDYLSEITGFDATSLQPNSGAQGEFAGLMVIRAFHQANGEPNRNIALIPASAHGTNPASAVMAGMKVVVVACDKHGNISIEDLREKAEAHKDNLAAFMVTYPSTHGVFEKKIMEACAIIHEFGGQVYMDGANMNAQVGLTSPGIIGADVCHLNLHKTFAIPHGGGGPGMGPICVKSHLAPFLPNNPVIETGGETAIEAISAAPWGSASILLISYGYIRLLGIKGLTESTRMAILNANYLKAQLEEDYNVLYVGQEYNRVAHELILDFNPFKHTVGIEVEDIAKRLIDYGFHAPTVSFPVAGTLMIEPTESEDKKELDRFIEAMKSIRDEIRAIESGTHDADNNVLKNAPHTMEDIMYDTWEFPYGRTEACFPVEHVKTQKFWPAASRVNNSHGDRNLICTCPSIMEYAEAE